MLSRRQQMKRDTKVAQIKSFMGNMKGNSSSEIKKGVLERKLLYIGNIVSDVALMMAIN